MFKIKPQKILLNIKTKNVLLVFLAVAFTAFPAQADITDSYNLAPFVPIVLETMMTIATSLYDFFVGNGHGIIYTLIYTF